jgi:hypothetical protein
MRGLSDEGLLVQMRSVLPVLQIAGRIRVVRSNSVVVCLLRPWYCANPRGEQDLLHKKLCGFQDS